MPQLESTTPTVSALTNSAGIDAAVVRRRHFVAGGASGVTVIAACALWFFALSNLGVSVEALPWYITVGVIGVVCARLAARRFLHADMVTAGGSPLRGQAAREPLSLLEAWAISYLAASLALLVWILIQLPHVPDTHRKLTRFIDIQLVSNADYANRQSPLSGTQEQKQLHKRQADKQTQQGSLSAEKVASVAQKSRHEESTNSKQKTDSQQTHNVPPRKQQTPARQLVPPVRTVAGPAAALQSMDAGAMILVKPAEPSAPAPASPKQPTKGKSQGNRPYMEEVQPPELVEMIENEGTADSTNVFADGGSSTGGKGAPTDLTAYLKALHKRIKIAWSPPRGQSHKAAVLFRVKHDGSLSFIKIIVASGDSATDEAAVKSIAASTKGNPLPASYSLPYLDVQYTFNYNVDELKEAGQATFQ
jgi:outer membrane biosynthesis protein TonB